MPRFSQSPKLYLSIFIVVMMVVIFVFLPEGV